MSLATTANESPWGMGHSLQATGETGMLIRGGGAVTDRYIPLRGREEQEEEKLKMTTAEPW
jgi:hypothetical protein